ncbi:hypothetical protein P7D85_06685 [Enterococcus hulanensis]|uniref:Uncharacterized protein n=1 Tax=Enterococcus hulanensis TaxID=2559929 RepID=A0ABU3EX57_9ENTE|nr:hypothetical protein [Enterococcus hulanensis]MDT2599455.1 hypothetical protein [Enterococcus hulanensis]MDT2608862.1 hypothetical protein [Enterococcus hulanensis]MDT2616617.1 hypothetical protein [Enterococcus hulanensis]MDT2627343.1 hypothetical protein [Enterococcus hulanensis]MDT2657209.1 hypothetical protein [Enterococcus hulanensis]
MKYYVKAMGYLDKNGRGAPNHEDAQGYDDIQLAELSALASGGFVVAIDDGRILSENAKTKATKQKKTTKANQAWMSK